MDTYYVLLCVRAVGGGNCLDELVQWVARDCCEGWGGLNLCSVCAQLAAGSLSQCGIRRYIIH
eukprot:7342382-Heterocapsa_arctica.AAC.1